MKGFKIITLMVVLLFVLASCSQESSSPVAPNVGGTEDLSARELGNFNTGPYPSSDDINEARYDIPDIPQFVICGPFKGTIGQPTFVSRFAVSVPTIGDYLLRYKTWFGTFWIMFRAKDAATLAIWMHAGDMFNELVIFTGTILSETVVWENDRVQVFEQLPMTMEPGADTWITERGFTLFSNEQGVTFFGYAPPWIDRCGPFPTLDPPT